MVAILSFSTLAFGASIEEGPLAETAQADVINCSRVYDELYGEGDWGNCLPYINLDEDCSGIGDTDLACAEVEVDMEYNGRARNDVNCEPHTTPTPPHDIIHPHKKCWTGEGVGRGWGQIQGKVILETFVTGGLYSPIRGQCDIKTTGGWCSITPEPAAFTTLSETSRMCIRGEATTTIIGAPPATAGTDWICDES
jgi:hypothetical protein